MHLRHLLKGKETCCIHLKAIRSRLAANIIHRERYIHVMDRSWLIPDSNYTSYNRINTGLFFHFSLNRFRNEFQLLDIAARISPIAFSWFLCSSNEQYLLFFHDKSADTYTIASPVNKAAGRASHSGRSIHITLL